MVRMFVDEGLVTGVGPALGAIGAFLLTRLMTRDPVARRGGRHEGDPDFHELEPNC